MFSPLFYLFATLMIVGGLAVVFMKNPVSSALSMVLSFIGLAGLFIGLNAYFVGVLQILVYAGAIMVLFIFIIMLLDLKEEEKHPRKGAALAAGIIIPTIILMQLTGVLTSQESPSSAPELAFKEASTLHKDGSIIKTRLLENRLPDVHLIGRKLYTEYNFPLQVVAVLLLVATVGCVSLSKKQTASTSNQKKLTTTPSMDEEIAAPPRTVALKMNTTPVTTKQPLEKPVPIVPDVAPSTPRKSKAAIEKGQNQDPKKGLVYITPPSDADDLKLISGIGPVLEGKLQGFGIYKFEQIANWSSANIAEFDNLLSFKGRITRDNWLTQADDFAAKKQSSENT